MMNDSRPMRASLLERAGYGVDRLPPIRPSAYPDDQAAARMGKPAAVVAAPVSHAKVSGTLDREALETGGFLVPGAPVSALAEEFRLIKRQLLAALRADPAMPRSVLVCSARPNDGKTFCAINLALSLAAERDLDVLLVDADVAKPDVLNTLGLPQGPGLLDALADPGLPVESLIIGTDVGQLSVLPAGTSTSGDTELLASARAKALLDALNAADPRRLVIFDSPPALAASPASVLAGHVGQVVMVVRADRTGEADLRQAVQSLDACPSIQLLLNAVSFGARADRFGSYYGENVA